MPLHATGLQRILIRVEPPGLILCRGWARPTMAHCGKNGFARKLRRGNMLFHAILFDEAERRLDCLKRLVQRLPVSRLVPQSSQRISKD